MEEEKYPHCVSEKGKGTAALLLPASARGSSHTLGWVAEHNKASKDPKLT